MNPPRRTSLKLQLTGESFIPVFGSHNPLLVTSLRPSGLKAMARAQSGVNSASLSFHLRISIPDSASQMVVVEFVTLATHFPSGLYVAKHVNRSLSGWGIKTRMSLPL